MARDDGGSLRSAVALYHLYTEQVPLGAEALVGGLLDRGAIGLVTTHDLALARIADDSARSSLRNVHLRDDLANGEIQFDYRLREGTVTRSNALDLMRQVGLDV